MKSAGIGALVAAVVVFVAGAVLGLKLVTQSAEVISSAPTCETRTVAVGEDLTANLVRVNVYNASRTAGLADRVSRLLQQRNFLPGTIANNPTDFTTDDIVIVADDADDPRVKLVQAQFAGDATVKQGTVPGVEGVSVLVGKNYAKKQLAKKAPSAMKSDRSITSCIPFAGTAD